MKGSGFNPQLCPVTLSLFPGAIQSIPSCLNGPVVIWGIHPPSCNINGYLVVTKKGNAISPCLTMNEGPNQVGLTVLPLGYATVYCLPILPQDNLPVVTHNT